MRQVRIWGKVVALSQNACFPCNMLHFHLLDKTCNTFKYNIIFTGFIIAIIVTGISIMARKKESSAPGGKGQKLKPTNKKLETLTSHRCYTSEWVKVKVKSTRNATHWWHQHGFGAISEFLRLYLLVKSIENTDPTLYEVQYLQCG